MAIFALILSVILLALDQLIKWWAVNSLASVGSITVIPHLLNFTYVENYGAAFGILQDKRLLLVLLTGSILGAAVYLLLSGKIKGKMLSMSVSLILAGGTGNLLDRIFRGFVVDYLDINPLFSYPVFNFADCCVVIGTGILVVYLLFFEDRDKKKAQGESC